MRLPSRFILSSIVAGIAVAASWAYFSRPVRDPAVGVIANPSAAVRSAPERPRPVPDAVLAARVTALAHQIQLIHAHIANLRSNNEPALRFLIASLAAYRLAWAELTRHNIDFGSAAGPDEVAVLPAVKP
jgi:hypothetical protein